MTSSRTLSVNAKSITVTYGGVRGAIGATGPAPQFQYSANGSSWHSSFVAGDLYLRISTDSGSTWGTAVLFAGEAATVDIGTVTTLAPGESVTVTNSGTVNDAIFDFGIPQGYTPSYQYSANGTDWHSTYIEGDLYTRISVDGGSTYTSAIRIKGETGAQGDPGGMTDLMSTEEVPTGDQNGTNKSFTLAHTPTGPVQVFFGDINGSVRMRYGTNFTNSGTALTLITFAPDSSLGDEFFVTYPY